MSLPKEEYIFLKKYSKKKIRKKDIIEISFPTLVRKFFAFFSKIFQKINVNSYNDEFAFWNRL